MRLTTGLFDKFTIFLVSFPICLLANRITIVDHMTCGALLETVLFVSSNLSIAVTALIRLRINNPYVSRSIDYKHLSRPVYIFHDDGGFWIHSSFPYQNDTVV